MFLGDNAGPFEMEQECIVCPYHFIIFVVLHGFNRDGIAVNFYHDHDVFVAAKRLDGELACLVGKRSFLYHVRLGVHIAYFLAVEVGGVACFQQYCLHFDGPYVIFCLVQMPLCGFDCLGIVLLDVAFSQHWLSHTVFSFDGFEPH
jgi:hypothetical protein